MSDGSGEERNRVSVYPPFSGPTARSGGGALPSIEDFLDELPLIDEFVHDAVYEESYYGAVDDEYDAGFDVEYDAEQRLMNESVAAADRPHGDLVSQRDDIAPGVDPADGWGVSEWQSYDWSSLSSLGRQSADRSLADAEWGSTEWSSGTVGNAGNIDKQSMGDSAGPTPQEVAWALDDIARRIRSGELLIDQIRGTPPEAAMAAVLAALLRTRG